MKRCPACGDENSDRAKFCQICGSPLPEAEAPAGEVRKVVTIIFADVAGSTQLGERLDPEALRRVMGRYFDAVAEVIERHGGTVEKFIGDAVMAVFGIPRLHEDDPLRAVRAAAEMRQVLASLDERLQREHRAGFTARIGVSTGEVVTGGGSSGQRLVTGDAVNVAARLEQAAAPGEILLGDTTHRLVKDAVDVEAVDPLDLKGKADRVPAFRLVAVRVDAAGHERHLDSPMVGRDKELEMLAAALDRAITERTSRMFTLLGPAGVGKSRLVAEFLNGPAIEATRLRGRCLSYGEGITFYPLAEVIQQAAGLDKDDNVETARRRLAVLVGGAPNADTIVSNVAGLRTLDAPVAVEDAYWSVRKLFECLAHDRPLVVVFDDIHWAEPVFLDLIEHLADWTRDAAVLLLCVTRPELLEVRTNWGGGKLNASSILLEPLDGETSSTLMDNLLGEADIPETARRRILDAAEGNPLFVEEILGMLIDDGLLRFEDGAWLAVEDLADVTVPPTIQLLLAARLDRLGAEERAVIERAAVEGKVFHGGAVATMASAALRPHVPTRLLALARKELIRPDRAEFAGEDAFRFRHLLIRDAAYHAMPKEQRADLHELFAGWLEGVAGERLPEYEEILAYHLQQAYRFRTELGSADEHTAKIAASAARHAVTAAERALAREDFPAARALLTRAADMATGRTRAQALVRLADADAAQHDFRACLDHAREAMDEAATRGDRVVTLRAAVLEQMALGQTDAVHTLRRIRQRVVEIRQELETLGDEAALVQALLAEAVCEFYSGRCDLARQIQERVLAMDVDLDPLRRREVIAGVSAAVHHGSTPIDEALVLADRLEPLGGGRLVPSMLLSYQRMALFAMAGREAEALAEVELSERLMAEIANPMVAVTMLQVHSDALIHLGRLEDAARVLREGIDVFDSLGETGFNSTMTALLAGLLCRLGRFGEAEHWVGRSIEMTAEDDFASQAQWRHAQARVLNARGEHDEALRLLDEAASFVEDTDYLMMRAETHENRALVLRDAGHAAEARNAYMQALELYERKGAVPAVAYVRAELPSLPH